MRKTTDKYFTSMPKNDAPDFMKVNMLLCRIDTCFSFWFIKSLIGVSTADLCREISSTTRLIGLVANSVSKRKLVPAI